MKMMNSEIEKRALTVAALAHAVEYLKRQADDVRENLKRWNDGELETYGSAGWGPNGFPAYYVGDGVLEAPECVVVIEAEITGLTSCIAKTLREMAEQPAEAAEATQDDRARSAYLNTCEECEAIESIGTREAVHEAKKLRTLAAEALAHYLRKHDAEWIEELETLQREAFAYSPDGHQDQRREAEGIGYHPIE